MEPERRGDVKFETVSADTVAFGKNNFLEVARKKGSARFKRSLTIPDEDEIKEFVAEKIKTL
jgi:hypothetical protein